MKNCSNSCCSGAKQTKTSDCASKNKMSSNSSSSKSSAKACSTKK